MVEKFSHLTAEGNPSMVDVSEKKITKRTAVAQSVVQLDQKILDQFTGDEINTQKGPVFQTAILAGIMAAKKTGDLIPLCHPLGLEDCSIDLSIENGLVTIKCFATLSGKTGVEMEALTGASVAALTIYDMCKGFSHNIVIKEIKLLEKRGGKSDVKRA